MPPRETPSIVSAGGDAPAARDLAVCDRVQGVWCGVRGWSLTYGVAGLVGAGTAVVSALMGAVSWPAALGAVAAVVLHAAVVLRSLPRLLGRDDARALAGVVMVSIVVLLTVAVAFAPWVAMIQFASYPLLWVVSSRRREAIVWTALSSVAVFFALAAGGDARVWVNAAVIQAVSFAGNIGLGLWFSAVYRHGMQTQDLLDRLTAAQDELAALHRDAGVVHERERLAAELHDTIAQTLAGTVLLAQRARRERGAGTLSDDTLALIEDAAREALAETRTLVAAGAPVSHGEGLAAALPLLVARIARESGLEIDLRADAVTGLDRESEVALLRCAQEGLSNARRHSGARRLQVALVETADAVELRVRDDGAGFDPDARADGFGLDGLRARLAHLGGHLHVDGTPGAVVVTARVPRETTSA